MLAGRLIITKWLLICLRTVDNFYDQVNGYCDDIMHCCTLIPRIASHKNNAKAKNDYLDAISNHKEIKSMREQLIMRINEVMNRANKLKTSQSEFSYLWIDSRTEYMHNFLTYGRQLTQVFYCNYCISIAILLHIYCIFIATG